MRFIAFNCAALLFFSFWVEGATIPVTSCGAILNVPGGKYKLVRDLDCSSGIAVLITAHDIHFNLAGRTLSGHSGASLGVLVESANGVEVRGGQLSEFDIGAATEGGSNTVFQALRISDCDEGIAAFGSARILGNTIENCSYGIEVETLNAFVSNNTVLSVSTIGIYVSPGDTVNPNNIEVTQNTVANSAAAIQLQRANGNKITDNVIANTKGNGITIGQSSNDVVEGNSITGSGGAGIGIGQSSFERLLNNTANGNNVGFYVGETSIPSDNNTIQGNTTNGNTNWGINIQGGSGNTIIGNTSLNNGQFDMRDVNETCVNTWTSNTFITQQDESGSGCIN